MTNETVFYSQLQPWTTVAAQPCMEQTAGKPIPTRIGIYFETPRPHPWRPTLGYEPVVASPLPSLPLTNPLVDACYTPYGMATQPLRNPDLVTGFDLNPGHGVRAAIYTRYTPREWTLYNKSNFEEAETQRKYGVACREKWEKIIRDSGPEGTNIGQRDSGRMLGDRISDLTFWRNTVNKELSELIVESGLLNEAIELMEKMNKELSEPLRICQECLYAREQREGIEIVHDEVEQSLLKEMDLVRAYRNRIHNLLDKALEQRKNNRAIQNLLETDVRSKEGALGIDSMCHQLNNMSKGIQYYGGIEQYDTTISNKQTWSENSNRVVQKSQDERGKSLQLRRDIGLLVNTCATEMWDAWSNTNNALARHVAETLDLKTRLQYTLEKLQKEIAAVEDTIERLKAGIVTKSPPMKVAQTRLEARIHRRGIENSKDQAQDRLIKEVIDMQKSLYILHRTLEEAEAQHQELLKTRAKLETNLQNKINTIFIDQDKCMGMRRFYPISIAIQY